MNINIKIKICGLFRSKDIDFVNSACPDYIGFVFASSRRQVSPDKAETLRSRLSNNITPIGVFVNAPIAEIAGLYNSGIISMAQLHGTEDKEYITQLKEMCGIPVIKTIIHDSVLQSTGQWSDESMCEKSEIDLIDYILFDSGAGSGKPFNWELLDTQKITKPWFLAGGITLENINEAIAINPYAIDVSSGAETDGIKDLGKILQLTNRVKNHISP